MILRKRCVWKNLAYTLLITANITFTYSQQNPELHSNFNSNQQQRNDFQIRNAPAQQFQQQLNLQNQINRYNYNTQNLQRYQNSNKPFIAITSFKNEHSPDGTFSYSYTTSDGQAQQASGYLKNRGIKNAEAQVVQGSYSYTSPEGKPVSIQYIADENGFRASGNSIPVPPPIPPEIQKSLELIARTQPVQSTFQRQYNLGQYNPNLYNEQRSNQQFQNSQQQQQLQLQQPQGFSNFG